MKRIAIAVCLSAAALLNAMEQDDQNNGLTEMNSAVRLPTATLSNDTEQNDQNNELTEMNDAVRLPAAALPDAMQGYNLNNGFMGMSRDVVLRLLNSVSFRYSPDKVRAIIGMNLQHYRWKNNPYFVNVRIKYCSDSIELMMMGGYYDLNISLNDQLAKAKKDGDEVLADAIADLIADVKDKQNYMSHRWFYEETALGWPTGNGINKFHYPTWGREVSPLDIEVINYYGKKTNKMIEEGRLLEVRTVVKWLQVDPDCNASKEDLDKILKKLGEVAKDGCEYVKGKTKEKNVLCNDHDPISCAIMRSLKK